MNTLRVGDTVKLSITSGSYRQCANLTGTVNIINYDERAPFPLVNVTFDDGSETGLTMRDVPLQYLVHAEKKPPKRRGALHLHAPKDKRTEKEKQAAAETWLSNMGYRVLGIGQYKRAAVCWSCTKEAQDAAPPGTRVRPVVVPCPKHKTALFSLDTGNTKGTPDWQVRHETRWPELGVLDVEWKRNEKSDRREDQQRLAAAGWSVIVDSETELAEAIVRFESEVLRIEPHSELMQYLARHGLIVKEGAI